VVFEGDSEEFLKGTKQGRYSRDRELRSKNTHHRGNPSQVALLGGEKKGLGGIIGGGLGKRTLNQKTNEKKISW